MLLAATAYKIAPTAEATNTLTNIASRWRHADRLLATDMKGNPQIAFSPTDPTMVALTNFNGIEVRDVKNNILRSRRDADGVGTSVFSPDGRIIAYTQNIEEGGKVVLWSHAENKIVREIPLNLAPEESFGNLTFSSDGQLLGACVGKQIQLWSPDSGGPSYSSIPLIHGTRCAFGFRSGSRKLAYIDGDDIVTWDIATRVATHSQLGPPKNRRLGPLPNPDDFFFFNRYSTFFVAPDGKTAVYSNADGDAAWWDFDREKREES